MKAVMDLFKGSTAAGDSSRRIWHAIAVGEREIEEGSYKQYLGGGAEQWERRGAFQVYLLRQKGLLPTSKLLDVGCGPIRAGMHFIKYLDKGNYCGIDFNKDFIKTAIAIAKEPDLAAKAPKFEVVEDFDLRRIEPVFDYAIAFSVLNHCSESQRMVFLRNIAGPLKRGGRAYISHCSWLSESSLTGTEMRCTGRVGMHDFDITQWGWPEPEKESVFPIIELTRS
jgi:SAM-dependent methyltransferase